MSVQNLIKFLEKRMSEIQNKFQETSGIYKTKSVPFDHSNRPSTVSNLSTEDRLRLFALENERLRGLLKSINEETEIELQLINSALLELSKEQENAIKRQNSESEKWKDDIKILEATLRFKTQEIFGIMDQLKRVETLLESEQLKSREWQNKAENLQRELTNTNGTNDSRKGNSDIENLYKNRIQKLEKILADLQNEKSQLKMENVQFGITHAEILTRLNKSTTKDSFDQQNARKTEEKSQQLFEELNTVKEEMKNFSRTQKQVLDLIKEENGQKKEGGLMEPSRVKSTHQLDINFQKSLYRNFPQNYGKDNNDPYVELSLNLPADFDNYENQQTSHYKKLKQVVKMLTEKQTQQFKNLEQKSEKVKELKKSNKNLEKELKSEQETNRALQEKFFKNEGFLKKQTEEIDKLKVEKSQLSENTQKLQKKVLKLEKVNLELKDSEQQVIALEKQKELMMNVNNQRNQDIHSLLNELNEKQDVLNQVVSRSQIHAEGSHIENDSNSALRNKYLKLKQFFISLREAYFQLQDEHSQVKVELEKEIRLREAILEDFLKRSDFFEARVEEFRDFHDRILEIKKSVINKQMG